MNRTTARKIAEEITNEQIQQMFENAKIGIKNWTERSDVNKGLTKGTAWNILAVNFDVKQKHHILAKTNMVREFGKFLPAEILVKYKNEKKSLPEPRHQDPIFDQIYK